jgi:hypothetical protein
MESQAFQMKFQAFQIEISGIPTHYFRHSNDFFQSFQITNSGIPTTFLRHPKLVIQASHEKNSVIPRNILQCLKHDLRCLNSSGGPVILYQS